ncbi:hypothetical protein N431DRAFT_471320 [Stipitochalara longipes BDJ]|nr:hypothetical protein N431DRAFT_471320 [Stipitochalara longipes BDJ]
MASIWKYGFMFLEILPWIIAFSISVNFVFLSSEPSQTAGEILLWILNSDDQIFLDFERSVLAGFGLAILFSRLLWFPLDELFRTAFIDLSREDKTGEIAAGWILGSLVVLVIVMAWVFMCAFILWVLLDDAKRFLAFLRRKKIEDPEATAKMLAERD